jgi:transcriptional regulator with XRE-family HTH domain
MATRKTTVHTSVSLAGLIKAKRGKQSLREAAQFCHISSSTLCRVESGELPDLVSFKKICTWLGLHCLDWLEIEEN